MTRYYTKEIEQELNRVADATRLDIVEVAVDEIARLRARIAELTAALKPFADAGAHNDCKGYDGWPVALGITLGDLRAARAAYRGEKE